MKETHFHLPAPPRIYVHHWSETKSPLATIICVQGLGGHGKYYECVAQQLCPRGIDIVAFDLRGHGKSGGTRGDIQSFTEYLEDINEVIMWVVQELKPANLHMLGESMGASIAIRYLIEHPDMMKKIKSLMLLAPVLEPYMNFKVREVLTFLFYALVDRTIPALHMRGYEDKGCREPEFNNFLRADELFIEKTSVRFMMKLNFFMNNSLRLVSKLTLPLLVMHGSSDKVTRYEKLMLQFNKLPPKLHKEWVDLTDAYHCILHDPLTPEVYRHLIAWLGFNK